MKKTDSNIEKLAREVVDSMDMETLLSFAIEQMMIFYSENEEEFQEDWNTYFSD